MPHQHKALECQKNGIRAHKAASVDCSVYTNIMKNSFNTFNIIKNNEMQHYGPVVAVAPVITIILHHRPCVGIFSLISSWNNGQTQTLMIHLKASCNFLHDSNESSERLNCFGS